MRRLPAFGRKAMKDGDGYDSGYGNRDHRDDDGRRVRNQKLAPPTPDEISEVVDAVTGATWGERNRIMEARFAARLSEVPDDVPAFSPPGSPLSSSTGS